MENFSHLVEVDADKKEICIYRVEASGNKIFYTSTSLPEVDLPSDVEPLRKFAQELGENLLLDSPAIRKIYGI